MFKTFEVTAPNLEEAIKTAQEKVNKQRDEISVEVVEKGKNGFFGLGSAPAKIKVTYEVQPSEAAKTFVENVLGYMGVDANVLVSENAENKTVRVEIDGEKMGTVIGKRGETLNAIQFLTNMAVNRGDGDFHRVTVDVENYREKREESLVQYAKKVAAKAVKYRKPMTLEAMNSYERRLIHAALKDFEGITTHSVGVDPNRRIIISPAFAARSFNSYKPRTAAQTDTVADTLNNNVSDEQEND